MCWEIVQVYIRRGDALSCVGVSAVTNRDGVLICRGGAYIVVMLMGGVTFIGKNDNVSVFRLEKKSQPVPMIASNADQQKVTDPIPA
jgi:hypothetical protein